MNGDGMISLNSGGLTQLIIGKASLIGPGAIIITGPSSCGKGEVSKGMCKLLDIDSHRWISMGELLRFSFGDASTTNEFRKTLATMHGIDNDRFLLHTDDATDSLRSKVEFQAVSVNKFLSQVRRHVVLENAWETITPIEWLQYCTLNGVLVPNRWTQALIEVKLNTMNDIRAQPILIDGYPRTVAAAKHLLATLRKLGIEVIKVLHLSISKREMLLRAGKRGREDDDFESLQKRYDFYIESVQPSVDYLKDTLGSGKIALIDAHQPAYLDDGTAKELNLKRSVDNVLVSCLLNLGLPEMVSNALIRSRDKDV